MKQKLNAKDFILIGVLTALMWIICMIISTIMSVAGPVTNVFYPSVVAIPNGIVMMLLLAKVPKKGVFTICSAIQAILFLLVGAFWFIPIGLVIGGVICDFLVMGRKEITMKSMTVAYALFSAIFAFSAICPIKFLQSAFVGAMEKNNIAQEYIDGMLNITSVPMLVVMFRYIPTLRIEYRQIRSTMDIRGISDTLWKRVSHPLATIEYILIPLLMRCLKVTDELAASGTTRGLELECRRYALRPIRFSWPEILVSLLGILFLAALLVLDQTRIGEIILWRV